MFTSQAGFKLTMWFKMTLNIRSSCLHHHSAGITNIHPHTQSLVLVIKSRWSEASTAPTELHPQS